MPCSSTAAPRRRGASSVTFEGVEALTASWSMIGDALLDHWWGARVCTLRDFESRATRVFRAKDGAFPDDEALELRELFNHHARSRLLCAMRVGPRRDGSRKRVAARQASGRTARRWSRLGALIPGVRSVMLRNDYERRLFNGDQGLIARVQSSPEGQAQPMAVFPRGHGFQVYPLEALADVAPAFAMTVHKAQGSEFDHVALILPQADTPMLTRELVYTAVTRARQSVLLVGTSDLLARAVHRTIERHSGIAERLETSGG